MPKHPITCEWCKKIFEVWPTRVRNGNPRFCSIKCRDKVFVGISHPAYNPDGYISKEYVEITHPSGHKKVKLHRYRMESKLGRSLNSNEIVHHKNGDKLDNRISNLEIMTINAHTHHHNPKMVTWAKEFSKCISCHTTGSPHQAKGLCSQCFKRQWYISHRNIRKSRASRDAYWIRSIR